MGQRGEGIHLLSLKEDLDEDEAKGLGLGGRRKERRRVSLLALILLGAVTGLTH